MIRQVPHVPCRRVVVIPYTHPFSVLLGFEFVDSLLQWSPMHTEATIDNMYIERAQSLCYATEISMTVDQLVLEIVDSDICVFSMLIDRCAPKLPVGYGWLTCLPEINNWSPLLHKVSDVINNMNERNR